MQAPRRPRNGTPSCAHNGAGKDGKQQQQQPPALAERQMIYEGVQLSRRDLGAGTAAWCAAMCLAPASAPPPAAAAAMLSLQDVTPQVKPAGPLSARSEPNAVFQAVRELAKISHEVACRTTVPHVPAAAAWRSSIFDLQFTNLDGAMYSGAEGYPNLPD